jgi:hypothetical protein
MADEHFVIEWSDNDGSGTSRSAETTATAQNKRRTLVNFNMSNLFDSPCVCVCGLPSRHTTTPPSFYDAGKNRQSTKSEM